MAQGIYLLVDGFEDPFFMQVGVQGFDDPIIALTRATKFLNQENQPFAEIGGELALIRARVTGFDDPIIAFEKMGLLDKPLVLTANGNTLKVEFLPPGGSSS